MAGAGDGVVLAAHAALFVVSLVLIRVDVREHRLPDVVVLPSCAGLAAALALAALWGGDTAPLGRACAGGLALFAGYLALRALYPWGLGGGDVKLALPLGVLLGWHGWAQLAVGAGAPFVLGGIHALWLLASRRARADGRIAFGPWMIVGAWAALLA